MLSPHVKEAHGFFNDIYGTFGRTVSRVLQGFKANRAFGFPQACGGIDDRADGGIGELKLTGQSAFRIGRHADDIGAVTRIAGDFRSGFKARSLSAGINAVGYDGFPRRRAALMRSAESAWSKGMVKSMCFTPASGES